MNNWEKKFLEAFCTEQGKTLGSNSYLDMGTKAKYIFNWFEEQRNKAIDELVEKAKALREGSLSHRVNLEELETIAEEIKNK